MLLLVLASVAVVCIEPGEHAYVGVRHAAAAAASSVAGVAGPGHELQRRLHGGGPAAAEGPHGLLRRPRGGGRASGHGQHPEPARWRGGVGPHGPHCGGRRRRRLLLARLGRARILAVVVLLEQVLPVALPHVGVASAGVLLLRREEVVVVAHHGGHVVRRGGRLVVVRVERERRERRGAGGVGGGGGSRADGDVERGVVGRDGSGAGGRKDGGLRLLQQPLDGLAVGLVAELAGRRLVGLGRERRCGWMGRERVACRRKEMGLRSHDFCEIRERRMRVHPGG